MDDARMFSAPLPDRKPRCVDDLYRTHSGWLRRRILSRFGDVMADDIVQETYIRIAPYQAQGVIRQADCAWARPKAAANPS